MFMQYDKVYGVWDREIQTFINPLHAPHTYFTLKQLFERNYRMIELFANVHFLPILLTDQTPTPDLDSRNVIGYLPHNEFRAIYGGYPDYGSNTLAWANVWWNNSMVDGNICFDASNTARFTEKLTRGLGLHELGHFMGFNHNNATDSVVSVTSNTAMYSGLLRRADILGYHAAYPKAERPTAHICVNEDMTFYIPSIEHEGKEVWLELKYRHDQEMDKHYLSVASTGIANDGADFIEKAFIRTGPDNIPVLHMQDVYYFGQVFDEMRFRFLPNNDLEWIP
jgi:hypothetical protein